MHEHNHAEESFFEHLHELWEQIADNVNFILVTLLVIAIIAVLAKMLESVIAKKTGHSELGKWSAKKIAGTALFAAIGGVLMILEITIPVIPAFYQLDFSELAGMMAGFLLGPVSAVIVEFIKALLHILLHGTHSVFVGEFASFVLGCCFVLPASYIYMLKHAKKNAVIGLAAGALSLIVCGALFNVFYLIPKFADLYGIGIEGILDMAKAVNPNITSLWTLVAFATVPFNVIKSLLVAVITFFIYKPISKLYHKIH